ncbi:MAG: hypothetical protein EBR82_55235 [Caulobacteraceae bacterium]|nr:hypothetical protein [Caulobacteraceae bacterium]
MYELQHGHAICYTLNLRNVEVNVAPATVIVCVPAIETLIAVWVPLIEMLVAVCVAPAVVILAVAVEAVTLIAQLAVFSEAETPVTNVIDDVDADPANVIVEVLPVPAKRITDVLPVPNTVADTVRDTKTAVTSSTGTSTKNHAVPSLAIAQSPAAAVFETGKNRFIADAVFGVSV